MEQQPEPAARRAPAPDLGHQGRVIPFVHDDQVRLGACGLGDGRGVAESRGVQLRVGFAPGVQARLAMVAAQVGQAPGVLGLVCRHLMAAEDQLAQHPTLEMGVSVVPAGRQGVGEVGDPHAAASESAA